MADWTAKLGCEELTSERRFGCGGSDDDMTLASDQENIISNALVTFGIIRKVAREFDDRRFDSPIHVQAEVAD